MRYGYPVYQPPAWTFAVFGAVAVAGNIWAEFYTMAVIAALWCGFLALDQRRRMGDWTSHG